MDIRVEFEDGRWFVLPDPCRITVNTPLFWLLLCRLSAVKRLRWTVYFEHGTPFNLQGHRPDRFYLPVTTMNTHIGSAAARRNVLAKELKAAGINPRETRDHEGAIGPLIPTEPGTYKYGVRVEDADSGEPISDDDPQLIVVSY